MKCSWKWLQWWGTCEMCMCRWGLEICLCLQKDLEIHVYTIEESKDNAKTRLGQHQPISLAFPMAVFFKNWKQTCLFTSSKACFCHGTAGSVGSSRTDEDRDLAHSTPSHSRQKKWPRYVWRWWPGSTKSPVTAYKGLTEASPRTSQDIMSGSAG